MNGELKAKKERPEGQHKTRKLKYYKINVMKTGFNLH